jgi:PAS domain S-box-containing protein
MTDTEELPRAESREDTTSFEQSLKYAEDMATLFEEEKAKRQALEVANERLRIEIQDRKQAEKERRRSEERLQGIFETAQDCIYIKDGSLNYTHVNPAMESLLQLPAPEIVGRDDVRLYGHEAARHLRASDLRVLRGEAFEEEHTRPINGILTTFLETKAPLRDESGAIIGICGIARNITDRMRRDSVIDETTSEYTSSAMKTAFAEARLVASQESLALLLGESGSGKDYMARFIHDNSLRSNGPFFTINCAAVAPELAESELFGHEQGAFTGARARKRGLLELAEGGTLFLNEIGELSPTLQAKLLTFLDTRSFTRIGGEKNTSVNARLIAATNKDLEEEVAGGRFRRDLFHRLNVFSIRIPPLRQRRKDIPVLVREIVSQMRREIRLSEEPIFGDDAMDLLQSYDWPGNVRELRNVLERALILTGGGRITPSRLGLDQRVDDWSFSTNFPDGRSLNDVAKDLKRAMVYEALRRCNNSPTCAARLLGISRNSLNHYIKTLGIKD